LRDGVRRSGNTGFTPVQWIGNSKGYDMTAALPWIDPPHIPEADALAELRAVGIPASTWQRRIYLNDGTNWSLHVARDGWVDEAQVWRAVWAWVAGRTVTGEVNTRQHFCKTCGDGAQPGFEECDPCHRRSVRARWKAPEDNWRANVRYARSKYR